MFLDNYDKFVISENVSTDRFLKLISYRKYICIRLYTHTNEYLSIIEICMSINLQVGKILFETWLEYE